MRRAAALAACLAALAAGCAHSSSPLVVGAVYPLSGGQARTGGIDEHRGVLLAADLVNADGGVGGRPINIRSVDVPGADAAPQAIDNLAADGVRVVLGSYGSTISEPAATEAARKGLVFWETGAVGEMSAPAQGRLIFRVPPSGAVLGTTAVAFIADQMAPRLHRPAASLRFAVANVDDAYGRAVAAGAVETIKARGLKLVGQFSYRLPGADYPALVRGMARVHPDVLFVSAYVDDAVALRRETVRQHLPLLASIGTSSSYCMPAFGNALGTDAVGLFASDKPDANAIGIEGLRPEARTLLQRARAEYRTRWGTEMSAPALAGFSAAWALFHDVMPAADSMSAEAVGRAAGAMNLPPGALPNGSGLRFGRAGTITAGANLDAASVIWEWTRPKWRAVVWPRNFATEPIRALPLAA